jgi:glycogen debranching enzyme
MRSAPRESTKLNLKKLSYNILLELATSEGINASGRDGVYGCIFGRDSALTILKILRAHYKKPSSELLQICRRSLLTLTTLQGKEFNINNGEQPGKFIHEFRKKEDTEHYRLLINHPELPWYADSQGTIKNYDSIDSTPLTLIALYKYFQITQDKEFLISVLPSVEAGLNWIITFGDLDKDIFIEYDFPADRKFGGLLVQSWTDSHESMKQASGEMPKYPVAPIEAESYAWLALNLWADFYDSQSPEFARKLKSQSQILKEKFNQKFIIKDCNRYFGIQALDGYKQQIKTITGNPLLALWASYKKGNKVESIVDDKYIGDFVRRAFMDDMFDSRGGIRTMSTQSKTYITGQDNYHNGSFWPILNGLIHEGLEVWNFSKEADMLKEASINAITQFGCPIELYVKIEDGSLKEYKNSSGQVSCHYQAWSAAALLDFSV